MRKEKDMTTEKRKHLAAWFSIIFIFVTLASLFYIVKEDCYPYLPEHRLARLSWLQIWQHSLSIV